MNQQAESSNQTRMKRMAANIIIAVAVLIFSRQLWPDFAHFQSREAWSMILGYIAFIGIGITLLIGPLKQWLPTRWTASLLYLRRDIGIWTGAAVFLHVGLVLVSFENGARFLFYLDDQQPATGWIHLFLDQNRGGWSIKISMMGIANYLGLIAFCCLLAMWLTSSDRAVRLLGGTAWRRLHVSNPIIFLLVALHGLIYVEGIKAEPLEAGDLLPLLFVVVLVRTITFIWTVVRSKYSSVKLKR
ncbi:ferric reductase-like transmembrane domain-containing protein [Brevibacillus humidisoli]|uniref:ferric reductase-like transmembrane domain-containing protein n=1 Tax=Brevibacillus humidisoli TaxID=2895522 RepID=UPI001E3264DD|nr:ferric reductase-like transmembrane domain-containing protein [Brevibacillus humidisoli]UFJ42692.1 ferric reductase-like transmembrane domain-containing protein [Brevibacillus humidisoli]